MKKNRIFFLKLFLGILILFILFYKVGFKKIFQVFLEMNPSYALLALIVYFSNFVIGTFNLKILTRALKRKINFGKLLRYYLLSWSLGLFVPGKIGEFSLVYFLKKEKIPMGKGTVIALIDKLITFIVLFAFTVFGFFLFFTEIQVLKLVVAVFLFFITFLFLIVSERGRTLIKRYILRKYAKKFKGFSRTLFYYLKKQKRILALNLVLTTAKWLINSLIIFILLLSFNQYVPFLVVVLITAMTVIVSLIPITLSGLGIRESAAVFLYGNIGINSSVVVGVYLIFLVLSYLIAAVATFLFLGKAGVQIE